MPQECLIAEFTDVTSFRTALEVLEKSQFSERDVSLVTKSDQVSESVIGDTKDTKPASPPAGKTTGAATIAGGTLGAMLGTATLMGPMLVAGPLIGMAAGAAGGSVLSAIESWGVHRDVGKGYEERVRNGSQLIVLTGKDIDLSEGEQLLKTCGPKSLERFQPVA
ncbi:hypothetical protein K227x_54630 [Rubripirellula lacrimiformis]|uniref:DUF1269 domain-containing protein n=1 Tax=Rubripirellula lacrimiformis TaxID=1930273 RepID=A0A517NIX3_9BACT|nr:DUF1269 domain-containing protein [Rubripirellula lacrimiformis]QDT07038.1 hypothetical protein K227x_54630 [Rubripirellula lacrimiformis]